MFPYWNAVKLAFSFRFTRLWSQHESSHFWTFSVVWWCAGMSWNPGIMHKSVWIYTSLYLTLFIFALVRPSWTLFCALSSPVFFSKYLVCTTEVLSSLRSSAYLHNRVLLLYNTKTMAPCHPKWFTMFMWNRAVGQWAWALSLLFTVKEVFCE